LKIHWMKQKGGNWLKGTLNSQISRYGPQ
jgi:hypothetical protein